MVNPHEDAEIGLAGPAFGLGAAMVVLALWLLTDQLIFAAIAGVAAGINLLNLLPESTLDGGREFHTMMRLQKLLAGATVAGAYFLAQDWLAAGNRACMFRPRLQRQIGRGGQLESDYHLLFVGCGGSISVPRPHRVSRTVPGDSANSSLCAVWHATTIIRSEHDDK